MRASSALVIAAGAVALARPPVVAQVAPASASAYAADLAARRAAAMTTFGADTAVMLWSAPSRVYSADTDYEYRQESNLLYLSGIDEPGSILVLVPGADAADRATIFVPAADPVHEMWEGHILTPAEVRATSGIAAVVPEKATEAFDAFVDRLLTPPAAGSDAAAFGAFSRALSTGRAHLAILGAADVSPTPDAAPRVAWARDLARRHPGLQIVDAAGVLAAQREIKTPYEQDVLRRSVRISAEAHVEGMKTTRPGRWEYEVEAAVEYWFHAHGALSWGYPSIVASGPNATTLHYTRSARQMQAGDLLLVDAAGDYQGLTGDITRTYPVSGRFTADQRAVYELVLRAQNAGIAAATPGGDPMAIVRAVRRTIGEGLLALGLVTDPRAATGDSPQIDWWFPHSPIHGIGMDVHEPLDRLAPGVAFVVEPGVYFRSDTFDRLMADPAQAEAARAIAPAFARVRDMGVRIEDSILMTAHGPDILSTAAPRLARDIESLVGTGR